MNAVKDSLFSKMLEEAQEQIKEHMVDAYYIGYHQGVMDRAELDD